MCAAAFPKTTLLLREKRFHKAENLFEGEPLKYLQDIW